MALQVRADVPVATLRFFSAIIPDGLTEAARLQMSTEHLRRMADVICRSLDYYPDRTQEDPAKRLPRK